jgi:hypothetical protein
MVQLQKIPCMFIVEPGAIPVVTVAGRSHAPGDEGAVRRRPFVERLADGMARKT